MRKKLLCFIMALIFLMGIYPTDTVKAASSTELNIYAIYLENSEKGDSTLLESDGQYLLIDMGTANQVPAIIKQLRVLGVTHLNVMISHLHTDHLGSSDSDIGAGFELLKQAGFVIDRLYLPSPSLASLSSTYPARYTRLQQFISSQGTGNIIYLTAGNKISFGSTSGTVVGPLNTSSIYPDKYTQYYTKKEREVYYENNCSLAMIFQCGNTRFFTAGDCYGDEAAGLVSAYGSSLKCDIMKLSHHGVGSGNSEELLSLIQPKYSFIANTGVTAKNENTGHWRVYNAYRRAAKYGMVYMIGNEKKTIIYHISNDNISLYKGSTISSGQKMTGWQYLYGADGKNRTHDMYYIASDGKAVTGIQHIGSHYYSFSDGGQMEYGTYSSSKKYSGWKTTSQGKRYYKLSSSKKYAYLSIGLTKVGSRYYYFDSNGYKVLNTESEAEESIIQIGNYYYGIDYEGEITVKDIEIINGETYYFNSKGHMVHSGEYKIDGKYYLFGEDGTMIYGENGTQLIEFGSHTYAVREDGSVVTGKKGSVDGVTYYFNSKGVVQKNKIIKIGKNKYYFDEDGAMVVDAKFKYKGKKYSSDEDGVVTRI